MTGQERGATAPPPTPRPCCVCGTSGATFESGEDLVWKCPDCRAYMARMDEAERELAVWRRRWERSDVTDSDLRLLLRAQGGLIRQEVS